MTFPEEKKHYLFFQLLKKRNGQNIHPQVRAILIQIKVAEIAKNVEKGEKIFWQKKEKEEEEFCDDSKQFSDGKSIFLSIRRFPGTVTKTVLNV